MERVGRKKNIEKFRRLTAVFIVAVLAAGMWPGAAYAKTESGVPAASLAVYLTADGKTELLHDYTVDEMAALTDGKNVRYSSIDALPARVLTVGNGVYISALVSDLKKYTDADVINYEKLKVTATDGWTRTHTKSGLDETKYYYEGLFNTDTWDRTTGKADASIAGNAVAVKPMLAVTSWQSRVMENTGDVSALIGEMGGDTTFRLCLGMSPSDLTSGKSTTSEYGKWINKIEIILGDASRGAPAGTGGETSEGAGWANKFTDVKGTDWFYGAVQFACSNNLFQGTAETVFSPNDMMTRAMFVTVLGRMAKADTANYRNDFRDVAPGQYYTGCVAWASANGIAAGDGDGAFRPNDMITREQMALILYRYVKYMGGDVSDTDNTKSLSYPDYAITMDAAKEAVSWAVNEGIIAGSGGNLEPKGKATRAQVARIMKNLAEAEALL
jgi:hypothetical protein